MALELDPKYKHVLLARHLPAKKKPNIRASDWDAHAPLDVDAACPIADKILAGHLAGLEFAAAGHSLLLRAKQTAHKLMTHKEHEIREELQLTPHDFADPDGFWAFYDNLKDGTNAEAFAAEREKMESEGQKVFRLVKYYASSVILPGEAALLVTHGPLIDLAYAVATNNWSFTRDIEKGEIVHFQLAKDGLLVSTTLLPVPA